MISLKKIEYHQAMMIHFELIQSVDQIFNTSLLLHLHYNSSQVESISVHFSSVLSSPVCSVDRVELELELVCSDPVWFGSVFSCPCLVQSNSYQFNSGTNLQKSNMHLTDHTRVGFSGNCGIQNSVHWSPPSAR